MNTDCLIVGQGLCGTHLSYYFSQLGVSFKIIDQFKPNASSRVAAGVINPVTGQQVVSTWMIDTLLPFCKNSYKWMEEKLKVPILKETGIVVFTHTLQMQQAYEKRLGQENSYIKAEKNSQYDQFFETGLGAFSIQPVLFIELHNLLNAWRSFLSQQNLLINQAFNEDYLQVFDDYIQYKNIIAKKIIFCSGINSYSSKFWQRLPYTLNKGQALIATIKHLPRKNIYKTGSITFIPWNEDEWWIGSSYERDFKNDEPDEQFRVTTEKSMKAVLKMPFQIKDHIAAVRPASVERKPFVGFHPHHKNVGILNGMGTKGCSLAPYFALQLAENIKYGKGIDPLADVNRYANVLKNAGH